MAVPLMSNASSATAGTSPEGPPVLGSCWPSGIVSRITVSLREVLSPVVADPVVLAAPVLAPVVSSLVVDLVGAPVVPVVPVVLVPVVVPVVPVVLRVVLKVVVPVVPVVPVVLVPVVVPVVPVVSARGPRALSQFLLVLSLRCMVSTSSKPSPQSMKSTPSVSRAKIRSSPAPANTSSSPSPGMISSLPPRPLIVSSPARPSRRTSPLVPTSVSSAAVPVRTFARASCPVKSAPTITTITVSKMYSRFIRLPPLVCLELVLLTFSLDLINRHWFKASSPRWLADRLCHKRNNSSFGTWRNFTELPRTPFLLTTGSILSEPVTVERHSTGLRSNSACIQHSGGNTRDREQQGIQDTFALLGAFRECAEPTQERDLNVGERVHIRVAKTYGSL